MVPDIAKAGHSFNGAFAYYLHDKRQEGDQEHPTTADRVAWTETRNLASDNTTTAKRVMIETARQADELKAASGVKNTGRKSTAHVYAYSLAWHPDEAEGLTRAEMVRAVDSSLKVLGAEDHQAVIVCHMERNHPHVHVILNRVHPETGKMLTTSNDRLELSKWANEYERKRGRIVTPKREEKRQLREQFDQVQRQAYAQEKRAQAEQAKPKTKAAQLAQAGQDQKARHRTEWDNLSASYKAAKDQAFTARRLEIGKAVERHKADCKPIWGQFFGEQCKAEWDSKKAQHRAEWDSLSASYKAAKGRALAARRLEIDRAVALHKAECKPIWAQYFREKSKAEAAFKQREQTLSGVIANALDATTHQRISGQLGNRGTLSATFSNVFSSQARKAAFEARQSMTRQELAERLKSILDREITGIKEQRTAGLAAARSSFDQARTALITRQNAERQHIFDQQNKARQELAGRLKSVLDREITGIKQRSAVDLAAARSSFDQARIALIARQDAERQQIRDQWRDLSLQKIRAQSGKEAVEPAPSRKPPVDRTRYEIPKIEDMRERRRAEHAASTRLQESHAMVSKDWTKAADPKPLKEAPTAKEFVARPSPAPSPSGDAPRAPERRLENVPAPAAEKPAGERVATQPRKDWTQTTKPPEAKPVPKMDWVHTAKPPEAKSVPKKDWTQTITPPETKPEAKKDWTQAADAPREFKTLPPRDKTPDRDR